jgi:hypothetical protein
VVRGCIASVNCSALALLVRVLVGVWFQAGEDERRSPAFMALFVVSVACIGIVVPIVLAQRLIKSNSRQPPQRADAVVV